MQVPPVVGIALGEPGRDDDSRTDALAVALLQGVEHAVVGHDDRRDIGRFRKRTDVWVGAHPHDLVVPGIHRIDVQAILVLQRPGEESPAILHARRRTDHRDRARIEHLVDRCPLAVGPDIGEFHRRFLRRHRVFIHPSLRPPRPPWRG